MDPEDFYELGESEYLDAYPHLAQIEAWYEAGEPDVDA